MSTSGLHAHTCVQDCAHTHTPQTEQNLWWFLCPLTHASHSTRVAPHWEPPSSHLKATQTTP